MSTPTTRSEWVDAMETFEDRASAYIKRFPSGECYLDPDDTPGPLLRLHAVLMELGFEHGWIDDDDDDLRK